MQTFKKSNEREAIWKKEKKRTALSWQTDFYTLCSVSGLLMPEEE